MKADVDRLVAQRVALNERLPEPHCRICGNWTACFYDNFKGTCPLGLKETNVKLEVVRRLFPVAERE